MAGEQTELEKRCNIETTLIRTTRRYDPGADFIWLHELWQRAMGIRWSISSVELRKKLSGATLSLVAERAGIPVGFCAVTYREQGPAGILIILVEPAFQRQGIGSLLLEEQEAYLKASGIRQLNIGFGNDGNYFWPGVPADAVSARHFFSNRGWKYDQPSFDLLLELSVYRTPYWVYSRLATAAVHLRLAEPVFREKIMAFEESWFPAWAEFFRNAMAESEYNNILLALDSEQAVVGTAILRAHVPAIWDADLGTRFGTLNVLGVAAGQQGKGIGIALAAKAMEILRERQCRVCYIQWTGLVDWYGKLGSKTWAEYRTGSKKLL